MCRATLERNWREDVAIGAAIPFIALGGGSLMTMAYGLLMPLMPKDQHGALTGFYSISRGVGARATLGRAADLVHPGRVFKATHGFQAMWIVCAAGSFGSLVFLRAMARASEDRRVLETR